MGIRTLSFELSEPSSRSPYNQWQKCQEFFDTSLSCQIEIFDVRHEYLVGCATFDRLLRILEQNPIFESSGRKPQRPVRYRLGCFLICYGTRGADPLQAAHKLGIDFGTVFLYCRPIVCALREIGLQVITCGNEDRYNETTRRVMCSTEYYTSQNFLAVADGWHRVLLLLSAGARDCSWNMVLVPSALRRDITI